MQLIALLLFALAVYFAVSRFFMFMFGTNQESNTTSFELSKEETQRNEEMVIVAIQNQWLLGQKSHLSDRYPHLVPIARERYLQYVEIYIKQERINLQGRYERGQITQDELLDTILLDDAISKKLAASIEQG